MRKWTTLESGYLNLGDQRRNQRFAEIIHTFGKNPACSIPQAFDSWYDVKACYNFWKSPLVMEQPIQDSIHQATAKRCEGLSRVLSLQDTTNVGFKVEAEGLGYLDHGMGKGLMCHNNLVVSTQGIPLGIISQKIWARDPAQMGKRKTRGSRPIEEKESYKWIASKHQAEELIGEKVGQIVTIADRESDIYELFAARRAQNSDLLIRASRERKTLEGESIWQELGSMPVMATTTVHLPGKNGKKSRKARLNVNWGSFVIKPPEKKKALQPIRVQAIIVKESTVPKGEKPVYWMLLTTMPVENKQEALQYIKWYAYRWLIERFHYVLKSGCRLEELQLRSADQLRKATITFSLVAYRLLWLLLESRHDPKQPCTKVLTEQEWKALYSNKFKTTEYPSTPPSISETVRWIGMLGGFIGRKSDGDPGVKNLWRGLKALDHIENMWQILQN